MSATRKPRQSRSKKTNGNGQLPGVDLDEIAELARRIPDLDDEEKRALIRQLRPQQTRRSEIQREQGERAKEIQGIKIPRNNDELWHLIKDLTGFEIPRVAVCPDHRAPFDWIADAYFNRHRAILVLASREQGKSLNAAILQYVNAETKNGCEGVIFADIQQQAKQVYRYLRSFIYEKDGKGSRKPKPQILGDPTRERTEWKTGSSVTCLVGSLSGVNSPHPNVVHADELDLMEWEIFEESRAMASSSVVDGLRIPALDVVTSTRKSMKGPMQRLIDEVDAAKREGHKPAWAVYASCFREVAAEVSCCRRADPIERVHRLVKLGQDPRALCSCDEVVKDTWGLRKDENGIERPIPRTLESVCRGDLFRSRGWFAYEDIVGKFQQMSKAKWEAQMECRRPMADGLYLPTFYRERFCTRGWIPRPEYGPIFQGVDWGGSAPGGNCVLWIQGPTHNPVELPGYELGQSIIVPQMSYVIFDELRQTDVGATKLADLVCMREATWKAQFPGWRVRGRFADMAGRQQRNDWHEHHPPLRTQWYISRDFDPTVETLQDLVGDGRLFVDLLHCASLCDDFEAWRQKNGREVHDESSHGPASARYALTNAVVLERRDGTKKTSNRALPVIKERAALDSGALAAVGFAPSTSGIETEQWRRSYGMLGPSSPGVDGWRNV